MKIPNPSGDLEPGDDMLGDKTVDIPLPLKGPTTVWGDVSCNEPGYRKQEHPRTGQIRIIPRGRTLGCPSIPGELC